MPIASCDGLSSPRSRASWMKGKETKKMEKQRTKWNTKEKRANRKLRTRFIELDFNSGDSYRIPVEDFLTLTLLGVDESHDLDPEKGIVREYKVCPFAYIKLKKAENELDAEFLNDMFDDNSLCGLRYLSAKGDVIETISLAYSPESENSKENTYCYTIFDEEKNLLIDIEGERN